MNKILAGFLAGVVLAVVFGIYVFLRGKALVAFFKGVDEGIAAVADQTLFYLILGGFAAASLFFGLISGVVYGLLGSPVNYRLVALGATVLFSILALVSKQPLPGDKVVWNFAVGGVLGVLVPLLVG